jgi:putative nucleotidyltransferase with HDIG domain
MEVRDRTSLGRLADWGAVWLADLSRFRSTAWLAIGGGIGVAYALTMAAGGTSSSLPHSFYLPIFAAAFVYGWVGGVFAGLVGGLVCGLLIPVQIGGPPQDTRTWLVRLTAFVLAGAIVGAFSSSLGVRLRQLQQVNAQVVFAFARAIDVMHRDTAEHSGTVSLHAVMIANELGLERRSIERIRWAALLHDVGKLAVPREVLDKPGRLTQSEWADVQAHVPASIDILAGIDAFKPYLEGIRHHHERFDGSGYPDGLSGESIPLDARIIAVADAFDAMTSHRPYRPSLSAADALAELRRASNTHFDPAIVEAFARTLTRTGTVPSARATRPQHTLGHAPT